MNFWSEIVKEVGTVLVEVLVRIAEEMETTIEQNTLKRRFYVVPPLNAQYEEVQPDLHSLERYDFSKMPDLPWYP